MAEPVAAVLKVLNEAGLLGVLVVVLISGAKRIWVFGWHHQNVIDRYEQTVQELRKERDDWKALVVAAQVKERRGSSAA